jgi:hypothetical protein
MRLLHRFICNRTVLVVLALCLAAPGASAQRAPRQDALEYFRALAADPERRAALRNALEASDVSVPIDEGIRRAFGASMQTVVEPDLESWEEIHEFFESHMRPFLGDLRGSADWQGATTSADTLHYAELVDRRTISGWSTRQESARDVPLAFTDVTVVNVRDGVARSDMTVIVAGDRISAVGPSGSVEIPDGARMVDGSGRYLIPGLWDMHVHTTTDRNTREVIFPLLVAHGITGIRSMAADCFETGEPNCEEDGSSATLATIEDVRRWRREMASGDLVGPRVVAGSFYVNSPPPGKPSTAQYPRTAEHGREHARLLHERGVDFIKVYDILSREAYFALADEASQLGLPFAGHVPIAVWASEASDAGQRSIEHLGMGNVLDECSSREDDLRQRLIAVFQEAEMGSRRASDGPAILPLTLEMLETHDAGKCAALAERFVRNGTWLVPNLMVARLPSELGRGWREDPYVKFLPPDERQYFEWAEETHSRDLGTPAERAPISRWVRGAVRAMHRADVRMLAGSDAGTPGVYWGIGLHQELELLVSAGLTEAEALRAATLAPAEYLGAADSLGTVEPGQVADLVLLDADPLADITNTQRISGVVLRGRYLDREALDGLLATAERAAAASPEPAPPGTSPDPGVVPGSNPPTPPPPKPAEGHTQTFNPEPS